jgi:hypothetical protein
MVYLGARLTRAARADAGVSTCTILPLGYHPPRTRLSLKDQQRQARQEWVLLRVATVVLVLTAAAVLVIISLIIATHS